MISRNSCILTVLDYGLQFFPSFSPDPPIAEGTDIYKVYFSPAKHARKTKMPSLLVWVLSLGSSALALQWSTSPWSGCQIVPGACRPDTVVPVYGHKRRQVWCSSAKNESVPDKFCRSERRPHSSIVCFGHCPRCLDGSWSSWSPRECQECVGKQRRQLKCRQPDQDGTGEHKVIEEHRACFSPSLCSSSSSSDYSSEVITQPAISQPSTALRPPEPLTAPFVPYLHVGAWSECQPQQEEEPKEGSRQDHKRGKKGRKKRKKRKNRSKRNHVPNLPNLPVAGPPPPTKPEGKSWTPRLPSDLEISFVANAVPEPRHGVQTREVQCRGQDGETLPFR